MTIGHRRLLDLAAAGELAEKTDGQLLKGFVGVGDRSALETLVVRHAPMVWGVCCRALGRQDAEDAFQAVFLVLMRKAATIRPAERVGSWLFGVARQTALNLRRDLARQSGRQARLVENAETRAGPDAPDFEQLARLDQELGRLPEKYRAAVLLCDLEGMSRKDAARQLGLPEGTVASRQARGRAILARRLVRCGLAAPAAGIEGVFQCAPAATSPALVLQTISTLAATAPGQVPSALSAIQLAERTVNAMFWNKLKTTVMLTAAAAIIAAGAMAVSLWARDRPMPVPTTSQPERTARAPGQQTPDSTDKKAEKEGSTSQIPDLLKAREEAAREAYTSGFEALSQVTRVGNTLFPMGKPEDVYTWSVRWLEAQLDLSGNHEQRLAAHEANIKRMKELQKKIEGQGELLPKSTLAAAKWYVAEAELALAKEKGKYRPEKK